MRQTSRKKTFILHDHTAVIGGQVGDNCGHEGNGELAGN